MRHLVLGGGGFIGSHLVRRLVDEGHEVTAVDVDFPEYRAPQWEGAQGRIIADMRFSNQVDVVLGAARPEVIWQLAADMGGVEYFHSSLDWFASVQNQRINATVMSEVKDLAPDARVIFTSTACALAVEKQTHLYWQTGMMDGECCPDCQRPWEYGPWALRESDIYWGTPDQLYGQEKRNSAIMYAGAPFDARIAFLHTVYGPYQEHSGIRMKFPSAVAQKARKARETGTLELFGDGRQIRTYLYIDDAIDRLLALSRVSDDPGFVNIGGSKPYTCDEVTEIALQAAFAGRDPSEGARVDHIPGPTGVEARACDNTKAREVLGKHLFENEHGGAPWVSLEEGMTNFIDWLDEVKPNVIY